MKSCKSFKEEISVPSLDGMSQEDGRRAPVSQSFYHSASQDPDLTGKLYKREVGGKPYSVLLMLRLALLSHRCLCRHLEIGRAHV